MRHHLLCTTVSAGLCLAAGLALTACSALPGAGPAASVQLRATGVAQPNPAQPTAGSLHFSKVSDGVRVRGSISGLRPNAPHAFHVHEKGDCSAADASSAGGHYNPTGMPHGAFNAAQHHVGDMPALSADGSGTAKVDFVSREFVLEGPDTIVGKAVIVHANPDDYASQPSGNAGARIACGVISAP